MSIQSITYESQSRLDMRIAPEASAFADLPVSAIRAPISKDHASSDKDKCMRRFAYLGDKRGHSRVREADLINVLSEGGKLFIDDLLNTRSDVGVPTHDLWLSTDRRIETCQMQLYGRQMP